MEEKETTEEEREVMDLYGSLQNRINQFIAVIRATHDRHDNVMIPLSNMLSMINDVGADYVGLLPVFTTEDELNELRQRTSPISSDVTKILPDIRRIIHQTMGSYERLLDAHAGSCEMLTLVSEKNITLEAFKVLMAGLSKRVEEIGAPLTQQHTEAGGIADKLKAECDRLYAAYEAFACTVTFQ